MTPIELEANLRAIRAIVDTDTTGCDIDTVLELGKKLSAMIGLSAECMAEASRHVQIARLKAVKTLEIKRYSPSVLLKMADAMISEELSRYQYADRLNAGIAHQLDFFRTVISLHKTELENSMKG